MRRRDTPWGTGLPILQTSVRVHFGLPRQDSGSGELAPLFFVISLPYLIDGVQKITQSNAILRYIARKHNLCGETEEEKTRVDILENQALDTRMQLAMVCYSPDFEKRKPEYLETLPEKMKLYSQFLGKHPWFAGDKITFVDFIAYDVLDLHRLFEPKCLDAFPNLKDFMSRFEGLKKISAYMKSSRFLPTPMYSKMAAWGNK
ncbi:glutathione S-transferase Mu 1 isoform X7 [Marmota marmota marmota]|uniref:glutathione S-transferase Mu 1 isoform X7 n=1 Tax=Marmota marmota marmota TaxID=9994 RepID=UPI0020922CB8|nr:glutathione S-transferase Mu 1 isoform X7 [Marmota marmota marmota]XP_048671087.1 glutathione S-transferase Mu 1 isoform X7 [Marmota marmota marmota]